MGGGFPIKAFGNDKLVLTEVGNGQRITSLPNVYKSIAFFQTSSFSNLYIKTSSPNNFNNQKLKTNNYSLPLLFPKIPSGLKRRKTIRMAKEMVSFQPA